MKNVYEKPILEEIRIQTEDILLVSGELDETGEDGVVYKKDKEWNVTGLV